MDKRIMLTRACAALLISYTLVSAAPARAQDESEVLPSLVADLNGDLVVELAAFGDSITRGEGDFTSPDSFVEQSDTIRAGREAGYPLRIEAFLGLDAINWGRPGDGLLQGGLQRYIGLVSSARPDVVVITEGTNDAGKGSSTGAMYRAYQTMINVAKAVGTVPVIATILPTCCGHAGQERFIESYNPQIQVLAAVNEIRLADANHAYRNTCNVASCNLLCRPEGLHPNIDGHDVLGEVVIATLLGIDIFAPDGATLLGQALAVDPSSIRTKPDPVVLPPPA